MAKSLEEILAEGLKNAFVDCQKIEGCGCTDSTNKKVSEYIAKPIAEAIELGGGKFEWCGECTIEELNDMTEVSNGDIYIVTDSGEVLKGKDGNELQVSSGDALIWTGEYWSVFLKTDLSGYATKEDLDLVKEKVLDIEVSGDTLVITKAFGG